MQIFRIACAQFEAVAGDRERNVSRMARYAGQAAELNCHLLLFPELCVTGYLRPGKIAPLAEPLSGNTIQGLRRTARETGIALAFGFPEQAPDGSRCYNSLVVLDRQGDIAGVYRKTHLWSSETEWASPGSSFPVFDVSGSRCGAWICYDTRFPEVGRAVAAQGADIGLVATAWLGPPEEWRLALKARALDNSLFVAAADIISHDHSLRCRGLSLIVGPHGEVLAQAEEDTEGLIWADLDPESLRSQRDHLHLLEHRRGDLFGDLS